MQQYYYLINERPEELQLYKVSTTNESKDMQLISTTQFSQLEEAFDHQNDKETEAFRQIIKQISKQHKNEQYEVLLVSESQKQLAQQVNNQLRYAVSDLAIKLRQQLQQQCPNNQQMYYCTQFARFTLQLNTESIDKLIISSVRMCNEASGEIQMYYIKLTEWATWSFPESLKLLSDRDCESTSNELTSTQLKFSVLHSIIGADRQKMQSNKSVQKLAKSNLFADENISQLQHSALTSSGVDIGKTERTQIKKLAKLILQLVKQHNQLKEYIKKRMLKIAPNFCKVLDPLTAAHLLAQAGTLRQLSIVPASTLQILGAELTLFNSYRNDTATPKFGLIYKCEKIHLKDKDLQGAVARRLANEAILALRTDLFCANEADVPDFALSRKIRKNPNIGSNCNKPEQKQELLNKYKKQTAHDSGEAKEEQEPVFFD